MLFAFKKKLINKSVIFHSTGLESSPHRKRCKLDPSQPVLGQVQLSTTTLQHIDCWKKQLTEFYLSQECSVDAWPPLKIVHFIHLSLVKQDKYAYSINLRTIQNDVDEVYGQKINIEFQDVFLNVEHGAVILFEGRPGSGKTTLMVRVSCDWARKQILDSNLLLFVRLRHLPTTGTVYLHDLIRVACSALSPEDINGLASYIEGQLGENVVFVLDGYDEYAPGANDKNYISRLVLKQVCSRSVVIVSSRPAATQRFRQDATIWVEVVGFMKEQVMQYIHSYFDKRKEKSDKLIQHIQKHPNLMNLCYLPLHCAMLCFFCTVDSTLPITETEFYRDFTLSLLTRGIRKQPVGCTNYPQNLESFDYLPDEYKVVFRKICEFAFKATVLSQQVFKHSEVQDICFENSSGNDEGNLGLVVIDRYFVKTGVDQTYTFLHLTLQEYLAAVYIARLSKSEQLGIVKAHRHLKHLCVTWRFLFGILDYSEQSTKNLFHLILETTIDDHLFHIQCAYESQHYSTSASTDVLQSHNHRLRFANAISSDLFCISYVLKNAKYAEIELLFDKCDFNEEEAVTFLEGVEDHRLSLKIM